MLVCVIRFYSGYCTRLNLRPPLLPMSNRVTSFVQFFTMQALKLVLVRSFLYLCFSEFVISSYSE